MVRPLRIDYPHAYYHVTCRGNERKDIFKDDRDRSTFLNKLQLSLDIYSVRLHCYVLMSNHFHLIVQTPKANLSEFMRHFNISYTAFYNRTHQRVGHLYQGRFKAVLVEADSYLLELSRYVHLNPVRLRSMKSRDYKGQLGYLEDYSWSSLNGYLSSRKSKPWVNYQEVLGYLDGSRKRYARFIEESLQEGYSTPWENLMGQVVLGQEDFWEGLKGKWREGKERVKEQPSLRVFQSIRPEEILSKVAGYFKLKPTQLMKKRSGHRDQRALAMEMMYRHSGIKQREIGRYVGDMMYSTVSHERQRIREVMERDSRLKGWSEDLESILGAKPKI